MLAMSSKESPPTTSSGTGSEGDVSENPNICSSSSLDGTSCAAISADAKPATKAPANHEYSNEYSSSGQVDARRRGVANLSRVDAWVTVAVITMQRKIQ